jgi:hypothetical protein
LTWNAVFTDHPALAVCVKLKHEADRVLETASKAVFGVGKFARE